MIKFNEGKHLDEVVDRAPCDKHDRPTGVPCWSVFPDRAGAGKTRAACGSRIKSAGFVGQISETAVQSKRKVVDANKKEVRK